MTFNVGMGGNSKSANLNKALGNSAKLTAQQQLAQKETNVNNIVNQFNEGKINRTTAISQLTALGVQSSFVADKNGKTNISFNGKVFTLTEPKKATTTKSGSTSTKSDNNGKTPASKSGTTFGVSKQYTETIKNKDGSYIKRYYMINQKGKQPVKDVLYNKSNVKLEETNFVISNLTQTAVKSDVTKFTNGLKTVSEEYNTTTGRLEKRKDFDREGRVTTEKTYYQPSGRVKTESKFDKNGKITERITYVDQDKTKSSTPSTTNFFASGVKTNNSVPKVDISDLIINQNKSKVEYFDKTGKPVSTEKFDTKERLIEKISYNAKAKVKTTATRTYSSSTSATGYTESIKNGKNKLVSQTRVAGSLKQVTNYDVATGKRASFADYNASGKMISRVHYDEKGQKIIEKQVLQNNGRHVTTYYDTNGKVINQIKDLNFKLKSIYNIIKAGGTNLENSLAAALKLINSGGHYTAEFINASYSGDNIDKILGINEGCTKKTFSQLTSAEQKYWLDKINPSYDEDGNIKEGATEVSKLGYTVQELDYFEFSNNSDLVTDILNIKSFQDRLRHLILNNISNGAFNFGNKAEYSYSSEFDESKDLQNSLGAVGIYDLKRNSNGSVTFKIRDTYDFDKESDGLSKVGAILQEEGVLKPFNTIMNVTLSAFEVGKLFNGTKNCYFKR